MTTPKPVLVVDYGAQYAQLIARRVREANVYSEIVPHSMPVAEMLAKRPAALILSGGPSSVYEDGPPQVDPGLFTAGVPVFGICYGFQAMAVALAGEAKHTGLREFGGTFYVTWLPTYLHEGRHVPQTVAAALSSLPLLFGGVGSLAAGYAAARIRPRTIAVVGFTLSGLLLFLVTRVGNTTAAMVLMGLASFCSDLTMPISWNACVEIGRRNTATISGAMNMFGNFAGFVAPVGGGLILARAAGDWNVLLYLMVGASLAAAACWLFLDPEKGLEPEKNLDPEKSPT